MNEFQNLFAPQIPGGAPLCECDVVEGLRAALEDREPKLCPMHQADELAARRLAKEREDLEAKRDLLAEVRAQIEVENEAQAEAHAQRQRDRARDEWLDRLDPLARDLAVLTNAPVPGLGAGANQDLAIGNDQGFRDVLSGMGIPTTSNPHYDDAA